MTGDETWVKFVNVETKQQSRQWTHTHSPNKPRKFKQSLANTRLMATVLWDRKGVLLIELLEPGTTITSGIYCETDKNCPEPLKTKGEECGRHVLCLCMKTHAHTQLHAHKPCSRNFIGTCLITHPTAWTSPRVITIFFCG